MFEKDPISISTKGNPDEYDAEAKSILEKIHGGLTVDEIQTIIFQEFINWFGEDTAGNFDKYKSIAQEISKIIKE